ncbi:DEAD/DEAH box helicase [Actinomyces glycerinitolerans]|uniref:DEAD/DEAH box helicase n=1 Tax=Actinomyces glycerinitolerans TaxID=1892869 RepID=UPI001FCD8CC1|nr:type ISP restriction/modification enzyme [Actinomyces glycerinitolerans]
MSQSPQNQSRVGALLDELYFNAQTQRGKGTSFERLVRQFLLTDPRYAERFDEVWMWRDWPDRGTRPDRGVDLVARERDTGELCAVQCKFYDPESQVTKADVDSFLAESGTGEFTSRLFVSTTDKWNSAAASTVENQAIPVSRIGLKDLFNSTIDWDKFNLATPEVMERAGRKTLREHQRRALDAVTQGLATADRGKLIMACGTGKTFTSLRIAEAMAGSGGGGVALFLVPSIALLSQTLLEWSAEAQVPLRSFAVCSDNKVGKGRGKTDLSEDISVVDLAIPATTDAEALARRLTRRAAPVDGVTPMTVVFSTYQSIDAVARAQGLGAPDFDLIICDEAHRTTGATLAGADESAFVRVHDNTYLRGRKRLYMTATPRIYDDSTKARAGQKNAVLASMDDADTYGEELFRLGFGEAVSRNLLTDYKVLVLTVSEDAVASRMQSSLARNGELTLDDAARIVGCWNALAKRSVNLSEYGTDIQPMRTAVAFARDIRSSKRFAASFNDVAEDYRTGLPEGDDAVAPAGGDGAGPQRRLGSVEVRHVDGSMNIMERNRLLGWLSGEGADGPGASSSGAGSSEDGDDGAVSCRVLSNARCLSEGVDVPALDAVMFLSPRKSQVDIVQSVGRVMRLAPGKRYGYIILPVAIPTGMAPEDVLADNDTFRVVWEVLQALRAHDERFDAMVNKIDLNRSKPDKVAIIDPFGPSAYDPDDDAVDLGEQAAFDLASLGKWKEAIYARLVQKVGSRRYWEQWAKDVAQIAARHRTRLEQRVADPAVAPEFAHFLDALRANLNDSITPASAIDMLSQHLVTKPVFDAVFDGYDFSATNPVAQVMGRMLRVLDGANLEAETEALEGFYTSVRERCAGIDNAEGKQRIITELYEKFFSQAFTKTAKSLGIVYTPVEIVDFILRSVDHLSHEHFGRGVTDAGVHVLDPFTGTGTFIVRLLQSGLIAPADLARKYAGELHANEILLLAYYIATANIEVAYRDLLAQAQQSGNDAGAGAQGADDGGYVPFDGIVLADTFQMSEGEGTLDTSFFVANNDRAAAQRKLDIRLIVANPPYSVGQESANDNNANQRYPDLDRRIAETYAARSTGTNKNSLYDSYLRAIRWASDRLGDAGVIGFVTNGGFIDANTADGVRLSLAEEFAHVYVFNLRGNQRTAGELSRREGGKVFGGGSRATVAITFLVKDPAHSGPAVLHYRDIGDYLSREDKLRIVDDSRIETMDWETITPNAAGDWINQRDPRYGSWQPIGEEQAPVFESYSRGVETGRDAWVYNFSAATLRESCQRLIGTYDAERGRVHRDHAAELAAGVAAKDLVTTDETQIKWTRDLYRSAEKDRAIRYNAHATYTGLYRPFCKQWLNASDGIIYLPAVLHRYFPTPAHDNLGFYIVGKGSDKPFSALAMTSVPDLAFWGSSNGQFFPRWTWEPVDQPARDAGMLDLGAGASGVVGNDGGSPDGESAGEVIGGYRRVDNITNATLRAYREAYGPTVGKDDIFYYVYGLLHSPDYRARYGADLKKSLPRIPLVASRADFVAIATAGRGLADLHLDYENVEPCELTLTVDGKEVPWAERDTIDPALLHVTKLRYAKTRVDGKPVADKTSIVYNEHVTVSGIPETTQDYLLGSRSGLDWIIDRYQVKPDKASGIVNDPNEWMAEGAGQGEMAGPQPRYLLDLIARVTTVSVRTQQIVKSLPPLDVRD